MVSNEKLKREYGLSDSELAELESSADNYEAGKWPEGTVSVMGRPTLFDERMVSVTYRDTESEVRLMDARASSLGMSRSSYLRSLVRRDLAKAGA